MWLYGEELKDTVRLIISIIAGLGLLLCWSLCVGCGPMCYRSSTERAYDIDVNGIRVITNGNDIDAQFLSNSINTLSKLLLNIKRINIDSMLTDTPLYLEYKEDLSARGLYYPDSHTAKVKWKHRPGVEEWALCVERYYVAAHEILHYIAWELYDIGDHTPDFFYDSSDIYNIEYQAYWKIRTSCERI